MNYRPFATFDSFAHHSSTHNAALVSTVAAAAFAAALFAFHLFVHLALLSRQTMICESIWKNLVDARAWCSAVVVEWLRSGRLSVLARVWNEVDAADADDGLGVPRVQRSFGSTPLSNCRGTPSARG